MTKYSECSCETDGVIILDDNELSMLQYLMWSEGVGVFGSKTLCWECWLARMHEKRS